MTDSSTADAVAPAFGSALPSLSVVVPVFNGEEWIPPTFDRLATAVRRSGWPDVELVVVDDGSTDGTATSLAGLDVPFLYRVVQQENRGRFLARKAGIDAATSELVLLLDIRVFIHEDALGNLAAQLRAHPERRVWNAHVDMDVRGNPFAQFWQAITFVAWRRYLARPRLVSYTADDFDLYPKGTTCFLAPRARLLEAYAAFGSYYDDLHRVNDDTSLIRSIASAEPVHLGPEFACTYHSRDSLSRFLRHAYHRGFVFVDGYFRRGSRYFWLLVAFLVATPVALVLAVKAPLLTVGLALALWVILSAGFLAAGAPPASVASFAALLPLFGVVYGAGIWSGVVLAAKTSMRRGRR